MVRSAPAPQSVLWEGSSHSEQTVFLPLLLSVSEQPAGQVLEKPFIGSHPMSKSTGFEGLVKCDVLKK